MALIKLGGLAQDVRGSLNGTTFSRNRGGAYVRSKVSPVQPVSPFSSAARAIFASLSQRWASALTALQRSGWVTFAATHTFVNVFGDAITLSGIAMYQSVNRAVKQVGDAYIDDAPTWLGVPAVLSLTPIVTETADEIDSLVLGVLLADTQPANTGIYVWGTPPIPAGRTPQRNDFRLMNQPMGMIIDPSDDLFQLYLDRFPLMSVPAGSIVYFRVALANGLTGEIGVGITQGVTVTAAIP